MYWMTMNQGRGTLAKTMLQKATQELGQRGVSMTFLRDISRRDR
jgi:hypothetical protein